MSFDIYDASVPVFIASLTSLSKFLAKGAAHAEAKGIKPEALLQARLAPDMHPLPNQIQIASDAAKGAAGRLSGVDAPSMPDTETTFADLQERIAKTIAYLKSLDRAAFAGADAKDLSIKVGPNEWKMTGAQFLTTFALPNFFFHVTTAYALLRHNGVELGKRDFLGG